MNIKFQRNFDTLKQIPAVSVILSQTYLVLYRLIAQGQLQQDQLEVTDSEVTDYIRTGDLPVSISANYFLSKTLSLIESSVREVEPSSNRKAAITGFMKVATRLKVLLFNAAPSPLDFEQSLEVVRQLMQQQFGENVSYEVVRAWDHFRMFRVVIAPDDHRLSQVELIVCTQPKQIFHQYHGES